MSLPNSPVAFSEFGELPPTYTLPELKTDGPYLHSAWAKNSDGTAVVSIGSTINANSISFKNGRRTLYAAWVPACIVTFDANIGHNPRGGQIFHPQNKTELIADIQIHIADEHRRPNLRRICVQRLVALRNQI